MMKYALIINLSIYYVNGLIELLMFFLSLKKRLTRERAGAGRGRTPSVIA